MTNEDQSNAGDYSLEINQSLNRFTQGTKDESKLKRKAALEQMKKQISASFNASSPNTLIYTPESLKTILKQTLNLLSDQMEKCRELASEIILLYLENETKNNNWDNDMSSMTLMTLYQRLGGKEVKESSEEIRLKLYTIFYKLIDLKTYNSSPGKNTFEIHLTEIIAILINSFSDNFAEVKKEGCACAKLIAHRLASSNFHMQSENLVKPLLANMTHQHSRVRKEIVECLCDVIRYGNNKSVSDVVSHLAQRLFDQASMVRMAVIKLAGTWLLELPDRYSFHYKLMPLLLTGFVDESNEVKSLAESLWWDVGVKYEKENEQDLKDKADFQETIPNSYPSEFRDRRPNLGCRELMRLNASKIVPAILNDIGDWVEATRVKSIQLLFVVIWQAEKNITQHLELVLQTLFKASMENLEIVQAQIYACSKLIGHFTEPDLTLRFVFKTIRKLSVLNSGAINILHGLLVGFGESNALSFVLIVDSLQLLNEFCLTTDAALHFKIHKCCLESFELKNRNYQQQEIDHVLAERFGYLLFRIAFTVYSLTGEQSLLDANATLLEKLENENLVSNVTSFITEFKSNCDAWNDNSLEPIIFGKLVKKYGLNTDIIEHVRFILRKTLDPAKDVQLRTRFLLLIPDIFSSATASSPSSQQNFIQTCCDEVIVQLVLPNIVWRAGRAASSVRMTACASLVLILQNDLFKSLQPKQETLDALIKIMLTCLDDDNRSTRLYACNIFLHALSMYGARYDYDQLHKLYPEFVKRLDDQSEEIRFEIIKVFNRYYLCLSTHKYDKVLYQAHLQTIYENLILYLDDSSTEIQSKIFDLLKNFASLGPEIMMEELQKAKDKHRNAKLCQDLLNHCNTLV